MKNDGALLPLPASWQECTKLGWKELDILLVSGDAYIDHPSFGVALIGRLLEKEGYRVAILAQPNFDSPTDFAAFPEPKLFCGITAGNLDSIVANYTGNGKVRDIDAYSPNGNPWRSAEKNKNNRTRPDRASIMYANLAKSTFKKTTILLGGVEASLRRFVHFDYKQNRLRGSILTDAKADILVYGMAEKAIVEIAGRLKDQQSLEGVSGSCLRRTDNEISDNYPQLNAEESVNVTTLPSWQEIGDNKALFLDAELSIDKHARNYSTDILLQKQQSSWVVQYPPNPPLTSKELDTLYQLPFTRKPHPLFKNVPAYNMIKDSITIVRGCSGNCSFCAITRHQGPISSSRSIDSIVQEAKRMTFEKDFNGTISDLGGPTANLFETSCNIDKCNRHDCLFPKVCKNLQINENSFLNLLKRVKEVPGVKNVFISSGLRMELLRKTPRLLKEIIKNHTPGSLKIAPEHTEKEVLRLMHKEPFAELEKFVHECRKHADPSKKNFEINPYIISAHPGCTEEHTKSMVTKLKRLGLTVRGFQDFTPTPGTISTAMYYCGIDKDRKQEIHIPGETSRRKQRAVLEKAFFQRTERPQRKKSTQKKSFKKKR